MRSSKIDLSGDGDYLTHGEVLFLNRRRIGLNQDEMAVRRGLSRHRYAMLERDEEPIGKLLPGGLTRSDLRLAKGLQPHEKCVVYRRRTGKLQRDIAADLDVSRVWLNRMETGTVDPTLLLCYWES